MNDELVDRVYETLKRNREAIDAAASARDISIVADIAANLWQQIANAKQSYIVVSTMTPIGTPSRAAMDAMAKSFRAKGLMVDCSGSNCVISYKHE